MSKTVDFIITFENGYDNRSNRIMDNQNTIIIHRIMLFVHCLKIDIKYPIISEKWVFHISIDYRTCGVRGRRSVGYFGFRNSFNNIYINNYIILC